MTTSTDWLSELVKLQALTSPDDVEAINGISGERCNFHPHDFTDRMLRKCLNFKTPAETFSEVLHFEGEFTFPLARE